MHVDVISRFKVSLKLLKERVRGNDILVRGIFLYNNK